MGLNKHITILTCAKDSVSKEYTPEGNELLNREKDESTNNFSSKIMHLFFGQNVGRLFTIVTFFNVLKSSKHIKCH